MPMVATVLPTAASFADASAVLMNVVAGDVATVTERPLGVVTVKFGVASDTTMPKRCTVGGDAVRGVAAVDRWLMGVGFVALTAADIGMTVLVVIGAAVVVVAASVV